MLGPCTFFGNCVSLVIAFTVERKKGKDEDKNKDKVKKLGIKLFREISGGSYNEKAETQ